MLLLLIFTENYGQAEEYSNKRTLNSFAQGNDILSLSGVFNTNNNTMGSAFFCEHFIKDGFSYTYGITGYISDPDLVWFDINQSLKGYITHYKIRPFVEARYSTLFSEQGITLNIGASAGVSYSEIIDDFGLEISYNYITPFVNFSDIESPYNMQTIRVAIYYQW